MADLATGLKAWVAAQLPDTDTGAGPITPTIHRGALTPIIDAVQGVEDRVDVLYGRPVFTESQRAGIQYIIDQTGGAEGLVLAVAANSDKISFDPESRATLTRLAGETQRSEEDVLALIHAAPIPTAVAAEFLSVHGDIDTINGRIDNLPTSEGVPQSVLDDIQALKDRLEFTPAEQLKIMANAGGIADNAQAILDLIQSVADANARIDGNRDARRITPQEILDIADLKDNLVLTQSEKDKINASDAVHTALENRIVKLEAADGGISEDEKTAIADNKEALFGEEIDVVGRWDENKAYVAGSKQFNALAIGDVVNTRLADGTEVYNEVANTTNFTSAGNTSAPDTAGNQADQDNRWRRKEYMQGLVDITLDEAAVDQRVINQLNPTLITQEAVSAPDVDSAPFTITSDTPYRGEDTITIADPNANPLFKDVITFTFGLRKTDGNGGFEPEFEYQVVQNGEVLLDRTLSNNTDTPTASFRGYLNQPFQVITQGRFLTGDGLTRTFTKHLTFIGGARKGPIYDAMIAAIDNETAADFQFIRGEIAKLQALTSGVDTALAGVSEAIQSNTDGIDEVRTFEHTTRAAIDTDVMQAVRNATIVPTDTPVINATELNTTLGGGANFAEQIKDDAIGNATQFLMRITDPSQVLDYGAGRVLDVYAGHVRGFILRPAAPEKTKNEPLYITTADGRGTPTSLAVLEFGVGDDPRTPNDAELFFTRDIPDENLPAGQTISNVSFAFAVRTNDNWQSITETIQLDLRSGEERSFAIPHVVGITFTATALADGRIKTVATHNAPDSTQQVSNGGAIRFDVGYVKTTITPAVSRGQTTVDLGVFTGNNVVGFDAIQTGDNAEATAHYTTPTGRFDTGYFVLDAHRLSFASDNHLFKMLISESATPLTPEIMGQLVATDEFLGLFERTNHHEDELDFNRVIVGRTPKGDRVVLGTDGTAIVEATSTITFSDNAEIVGAHPEFGGGMRIETFTRLLTGAAIANGAHPIPVPTGNNITYHGWSAKVITASATPATFRIRGGINTVEGGNESLDLAVAGASVAHAFGIPRDTQTNNITIFQRAGNISTTAVLRISITVAQAVPIDEFPPQKTATATIRGAGGGEGKPVEEAFTYANGTLTLPTGRTLADYTFIEFRWNTDSADSSTIATHMVMASTLIESSDTIVGEGVDPSFTHRDLQIPSASLTGTSTTIAPRVNEGVATVNAKGMIF